MAKLFGNHYFMVAIYIPVLRTKSIKYFHHYFYKYTVSNHFWLWRLHITHNIVVTVLKISSRNMKRRRRQEEPLLVGPCFSHASAGSRRQLPVLGRNVCVRPHYGSQSQMMDVQHGNWQPLTLGHLSTYRYTALSLTTGNATFKFYLLVLQGLISVCLFLCLKGVCWFLNESRTVSNQS